MTSTKVNPAANHLDEISKSIIGQLQEDGRRAYATIGKAVGLSEAAVRQRVQKLTDSGVIQIVAVTDPLQTGFQREAMVGINVDGDLDELADRLCDLGEVNYVVISAGSFDIICEVLAVDDDHLLDILRRIRGVPGIRRIESFMYLKLKKQTYNWGIH